MKESEFYLHLLTGYFRGAVGRIAIAGLLNAELPSKALTANETDLLRSCEWALRHIAGRGECTPDRELHYLWTCLRKETRFNVAERDRIRNSAPAPVRIPLCQGIFAVLVNHPGYWGMRLAVRDRRLLRSLTNVETDSALQKMLAWHGIRDGVAGAGRYYVIPRSRLKRFLVELAAFIETRCSAALSD